MHGTRVPSSYKSQITSFSVMVRASFSRKMQMGRKILTPIRLFIPHFLKHEALNLYLLIQVINPLTGNPMCVVISRCQLFGIHFICRFNNVELLGINLSRRRAQYWARCLRRWKNAEPKLSRFSVSAFIPRKCKAALIMHPCSKVVGYVIIFVDWYVCISVD